MPNSVSLLLPDGSAERQESTPWTARSYLKEFRYTGQYTGAVLCRQAIQPVRQAIGVGESARADFGDGLLGGLLDHATWGGHGGGLLQKSKVFQRAYSADCTQGCSLR